MIVFPVNTLVTLTGQLSPATFLTLWGAACTAAVVGLVLALGPRRSLDGPFTVLPAVAGAHAAGHVDQVEDTSERTGARHAGIGVAQWRPQHTRAAALRRGRHFAGSRAWSGNLLDHTTEVSSAELLEATHG